MSNVIARVDIFSKSDGAKIGEMNISDDGIIEGFVFEKAAKNIEQAVQACSGSDRFVACSIFIK